MIAKRIAMRGGTAKKDFAGRARNERRAMTPVRTVGRMYNSLN